MKTMKQSLMAAVMLCAQALVAQTLTNNYTFNENASIPVNSVFGVTLSTNLAGDFTSGMMISNVTVNLDISGGFNGDLYGYLQGPNGGFAVLLNRVGVQSGNNFGYSDSGFNVTLADNGANGIHFYQTDSPVYNGNGQLTGTWQPDGENINPNSPAADFPTGQTAMLSSFEGTDPNGTWTLFLANLANGSPGTVVSWGLDIVTVPEPSIWSLTGIGMAGVLLIHRFRRRKSHSV